jgi:hypothetical protein
MMQQKIHRQFVLPIIVPLGVALVVGLVIFGVGEALLNLYNRDFTSEFKRPELWTAIAVAIAIILGAGFLSTYKGSLGPLDKPVAFGTRPMLAPLPTPIEVQALRGPSGTAQDIKPGFILYARNGALAKVIEMLPDVKGDTSHHRMGFIYAKGLHGADDQLWIPVEAVAATYPETQTAVLAISGDETAAFGWNQAPAAFVNYARQHENKLY